MQVHARASEHEDNDLLLLVLLKGRLSDLMGPLEFAIAACLRLSYMSDLERSTQLYTLKRRRALTDVSLQSCIHYALPSWYASATQNNWLASCASVHLTLPGARQNEHLEEMQ